MRVVARGVIKIAVKGVVSARKVVVVKDPVLPRTLVSPVVAKKVVIGIDQRRLATRKENQSYATAVINQATSDLIAQRGQGE